MIGQALVVAWSFTISSLSTTPQIIDLGSAPKNSDYIPTEIIVTFQNNDGSPHTGPAFRISLGTHPKYPQMVFSASFNAEPKYYHENVNMSHFHIVPANHDLYVMLQSLSPNFPEQDLPIHVDILAYPSDNDLYCPSAISSSDNGATGIPSNFYINSGAAIPGETYHFTAANITISKQAVGTCQYKSQAGSLLGLGIKTKVTADRGHPYNKWKLISYQDLGCFHNTNNCPFSQD